MNAEEVIAEIEALEPEAREIVLICSWRSKGGSGHEQAAMPDGGYPGNRAAAESCEMV